MKNQAPLSDESTSPHDAEHKRKSAVSHWIFSALPALLGVMVSMPQNVQAQPVVVSFCDLGTANEQSSKAEDVNEDGLIVGTAWRLTGVPTVFIVEAATLALGNVVHNFIGNGEAHAISVGFRAAGEPAVVWELLAGQAINLLNILGNGNSPNQFFRAADIIERGYAVGCCIPSGDHAARIDTQGGAWIPLQTLGGSYSMAHGINEADESVGTASRPGNAIHAAVYWDSAGNVVDLGTLGGIEGTAYDINEYGQIVGGSILPANPYPRHAFVIPPGAGQMIDLGTFPLNGDDSEALKTNNRGHIVGDAWFVADGGRHQRAVLWEQTSPTTWVLHDLTNLTGPLANGWTLKVAASINNANQIVGWGLDPNGKTRAFFMEVNI